MADSLIGLFDSTEFMPHGYCYQWTTELIWLHVISDLLVGLSYVTIPISLVYLIVKRRDMPFDWMFVAFGIFILACGATHFMEVVTVWEPVYWASGVVKSVTAVASVTTAVLMRRVVPQALLIPSPSQLRGLNENLENEIGERRQVEAELLAIRNDLERRVEERTRELVRANEELMAEDNQNDMELTLAALEEFRLRNEVVVVHDGVQVLDYLYCRGEYDRRPEGHPLVVLLDLKMPKLDGLEVLRQVKSDSTLRTIPIVMLTSSNEERDVVESYNLGVNAYVVKPVVFDRFIDVVKQIGLFWVLINEPPPGATPR